MDRPEPSTVTMASCKYQSLFPYEPSVAAAAFFASAFGLSTLLHLGQAVYFKTWFMIPLVIGASCEYFSSDDQPTT